MFIKFQLLSCRHVCLYRVQKKRYSGSLNEKPHVWGLMVLTVSMKGDKHSNCLSKQNTSNCFSTWDTILICLKSLKTVLTQHFGTLKMMVACHVRQEVA